MSGPDELRKPVLQSVLQWHYSTEASLPPAIRITVKFDPLDAPPVRAAELPSPPARSEPAGTLKGIEFVGVSPEVQQRVREALPVHEGDQVSTRSREQILAAARKVDEHFSARLNFGPNNSATVTLALGSPLAPRPGNPLSPGNAAAPNAAAPGPPQRIRVGGNVQATNLIQKVTPAYPPAAKEARVQGVVRFTATVAKDGSIANLDLISGPALLVPAATEAVKQWVYRPTLLNGNPIEVITEIEVNFTLSQ